LIEPVDSGEQLPVRVLVLGALSVEFGGRVLHVAGSHRRRLLALLASRPGRAVPVDAIVDALWGLIRRRAR
jgi:DNA-binding SARP family transcriptional activator